VSVGDVAAVAPGVGALCPRLPTDACVGPPGALWGACDVAAGVSFGATVAVGIAVGATVGVAVGIAVGVGVGAV
jgi:hypothetical protein